MFLSSCVFFASVGGGRAVSQGSVALDGTLFDSAYDISHLVAFFTWAISHPRCARLSERRDSLLTLSARRTPFLRASDLYPTGPQGAKGCRDFDRRCSFTANHELGFRLTAVIARRQEQSSSLLEPLPMKQMLWVFFSFFISEVIARSRDVAGSPTCCTQIGTSCGGDCASLRCVFLSPDVRLNIHVAQTLVRNVFVGSHALHP